MRLYGWEKENYPHNHDIERRYILIFILKKFLQTIALPPALPLLLIAAGLVSTWKNKKQRLATTLIFAGFSISVFFSIPLTVDIMARQLESIPAVQPQQLEQAQAIVIMGGGQRGWASEYGGDMPSKSTLERLCYGATLARRAKLPVLVTGGSPSDGAAEAKIMAKVLNDLFSVKTAWIESRSLDTTDNAKFSAEILKRSNIKTVVLVTHAAHMRRAVNEFRHAGLTVIPAPTAFFSDERRKPILFGLVPNMSSIYTGFYVTHEWVGLLAQNIRHRLS
jgi:uncharacterized SAM-binding protein YcdF (DUF218 family)